MRLSAKVFLKSRTIFAEGLKSKNKRIFAKSAGAKLWKRAKVALNRYQQKLKARDIGKYSKKEFKEKFGKLVSETKEGWGFGYGAL